MSNNKRMFHLIANGLELIADEIDGERVDEDDMFTALNALGRLSLAWSDELSTSALEVATCRFGGTCEVFQELPDRINKLEHEVAKTQLLLHAEY